MNNYIWILLLLILFGGSGNGCNCDCGGNRPRCNDRPSGKPCGPGSGPGFPPPPPAPCDCGCRKEEPSCPGPSPCPRLLLPVRDLLHVRFHRHLRHVLPMTTDAAVPADVFSLRHSRPLSCQSVNLKMQSHRQMTVTCILYAKLQASFFHMVNNRIGQAAISG